MEGRCVFVFFMIFNSILGLTGLALLAAGIALLVKKPNVGRYQKSMTPDKVYIAMTVIGGYITTLLILGACSWKRAGALIAYFVLSLLLMLAESAVMILIRIIESNMDYSTFTPTAKDAFELGILIGYIIFGVSLGIAFLSFFFSTIYFCRMKKDDPYENVRNMEYASIAKYQNV